MSALGAGALEVVVQRGAKVRVHAVVDDHPRPLTWGQATQVGQADFGDEDVDVMLAVVDVADHRHHAGNCPALGYRLGDEDRQVRVAGEIAGAADAVHHLGAADVGRVDVAVQVELQRRVDADDAQATDHFRVVGDFLRAQHQLVLVLFQVVEHPRVAALGQGDRATRGEVHLAGVDQVEGRVLQHLGVHGQVVERRIDQAAHHRVGDAANPGLQRAEVARQAPGFDFLGEEGDQVVGDALGLGIRRGHRGVGVGLVGDDDGDDLFRRDRDRGAADATVHGHQRDRRAGRPVAGDIDIVQAFQVGVVGQVDLDDHLLGEDRETGRVAHRGGRHDMPLFGDGHGFDHRDIRLLQLQVADLLDGVGQVLVDEHHLAGIDRAAQGRVDLERHAPRQHAGFRQLLVEVVAQAGAGHQADLQRPGLGSLGEGARHRLGFAGTGETAHADGHAVLDQFGGLRRIHHLVQQRGQAYSIAIHGHNSGSGQKQGGILGAACAPSASTKVA